MWRPERRIAGTHPLHRHELKTLDIRRYRSGLASWSIRCLPVNRGGMQTQTRRANFGRQTPAIREFLDSVNTRESQVK
jgi:hypothetical protein